MKAKRSKLKSSTKAGAKPASEPAKVNPFEVKVNKQRHDVLGRKSKSDRGLPGVSRNKAIKKRKETLLQEYILRNKSSAFLDKRIGEFDTSMNPDDKMAARLAQERKISQKKSVFSLNEEEELTHLGKSINDMETHDDPRSDDEDLYDKLGRDFADKTNFGGFLTKADPNSDAVKSRREAIEKLIAESKKLKYERQVEKDENFELTEKLDNDWKEFQGLLAASKNKKRAAAGEKEASTDDYDVLVKQLRFEPLAGQASERVKTEDEVAREERKRLEKLEKERQLRAQGSAAQKDTKRQFASADDLDDGFYKCESVTAATAASESEDELEGDTSGAHSKEKSDASDAESDGENEDGSEEDEESDGDSYADLASDNEGDSDNEGLEDRSSNLAQKPKQEAEPIANAASTNDHKHKAVKQVAADKKPTAVRDVPDSEEAFSKLMRKKTADEKSALIEHMIASNRTTAASRKKLEMLFVFLLQHLSDTADTDIHLVDKLCPHIYSLVQLSPVACGRFLLDVISEKEEELQGLLSKKANHTVPFPSFSTLVFLKLVGQCYSASDFSHVIATPAMLFASHMLTCCALKDPADFLRGTFVANVFLEYITYSRRFSPELLAFLERLLRHKALKFEADSPSIQGKQDLKLSLKALGSSQVEMNDELRVKLIHAGVKLAEKCASLYEALPSYPEISASLLSVCQALDSRAYPESLKALVESTLAKLSQKVERKPLRPSKKPPPMKRLLEPKFSMKFDGRKHFMGGEKKAELKRLNYKHKKEMKGAMREIRRDNQFLAHHVLKERLQRDAERKEKVKRIYQELASQEGEFKALKRKKEKLSNRM